MLNFKNVPRYDISTFPLLYFCRMSLYPSLEDLKVDKVMRVMKSIVVFFKRWLKKNPKYRKCHLLIMLFTSEWRKLCKESWDGKTRPSLCWIEVNIFYVNVCFLWQAQAQYAQSTSSAPAITESPYQPAVQGMPSSSKSVAPSCLFIYFLGS